MQSHIIGPQICYDTKKGHCVMFYEYIDGLVHERRNSIAVAHRYAIFMAGMWYF